MNGDISVTMITSSVAVKLTECFSIEWTRNSIQNQWFSQNNILTHTQAHALTIAKLIYFRVFDDWKANIRLSLCTEVWILSSIKYQSKQTGFGIECGTTVLWSCGYIDCSIWNEMVSVIDYMFLYEKTDCFSCSLFACVLSRVGVSPVCIHIATWMERHVNVCFRSIEWRDSLHLFHAQHTFFSRNIFSFGSRTSRFCV